MKLDFQAKFLQYLNQKKRTDEGFTLIELLVVIIIIGILAAIALPSMLGQVNKAKQTEARQNIGAMNRAQQAFQLEYQEFTTGIGDLGIGIRTQSDNYTYVINGNIDGVIKNLATPRKPALKAYAGLVSTLQSAAGSATSEVLTIAIACESKQPTLAAFNNSPTPTDIEAGECGANYRSLGRTK